MKALFFLSVIAIALSISIFSANAESQYNSSFYPTQNTTNFSQIIGAPTYASVKINMHNFMVAKTMGETSSNMMYKSQQQYAQDAHNYWLKNPLPTINQTEKMQLDKLPIAYQNSGYNNMQHFTNYDYSVQDSKKSIIATVKEYLANGRNDAPAFVPCKSWHACNVPTFVPQVSDEMQHVTLTNSTNNTSQILLKPEFSLHPTGFIHNYGKVQNMSDLQNYMVSLNRTK